MSSPVYPCDITVTIAHVLHHEEHHGGWHALRLHAPLCATKVQPGHCAQWEYSDTRYSAPVMRADTDAGWLELLYQDSTSRPALRTGDPVQLTAPVGEAFMPMESGSRPLLIGEGPGIAAIIFLVERLAKQRSAYELMTLLESDGFFPFPPYPSRILVPGMPAGVIATMPLLEEQNIISRLCSAQGQAGCFEGDVGGLARIWLSALIETQRKDIEIFASGPRAMLEQIKALAGHYRLPCQLVEISPATR